MLRSIACQDFFGPDRAAAMKPRCVSLLYILYNIEHGTATLVVRQIHA